MESYNTFTNTELEEEIKRLKAKYYELQKITIEGYQQMLELAAKNHEAEEILNMRMGKGKRNE